MPANSGAIAGTTAHNHSIGADQGGFLQNNITGVNGTANGSLLMFDGGSIAQDLPAGNAGDLLTMGATTPAWSPAGAPPTSTWKLLGYNKTTVNSSSFGVFWDEDDCCDYYQAWAFTTYFSGATPRRYLSFSLDGSTWDHSAIYAARYSINFGAMGTAINNVGISSATGTLGNQFSCFHIQNASDITRATTTWDWACTNSSNTGGTAPDQTVFTSGLFGSSDKIRGVEIWDGGSATVFGIGSSLIVVGLQTS